MAVQTSAFRAFLTSYLVRRADPSTPFDQLSLQQLWEMFFKVRKELALEERQPRSADEMFQALRGLNMETAAADNNGVTQHLIEETISEVQKNVIRVRAMHPEDFFAPSSEQVPFTDTQLDALLQKVTAAPSVLQIQYILHQLPTSSGTFSADQVLTYYFTSFDPDACAAFVPPTTPPLPATPVPDLARAQGVGILRSFAYSPTARPTSAEAAAARAQKLHPTVKTAIKKISEKFDRRLLKRLLARIDQPFPLCPKSPLLLRQVRKYFWENHKVLKFDLTAEVKAADLRAYPSLAERLYVIDCGFQALYGYRLHLVQLTALAALIIQPQVTRRLLQVLTGEGKSNIITALAIYLVKCKDPDCPYVDIITTHHHLAKRDAGGELKRMFDLFGVTVAHIAVTKDTLRPRMARPEYLANVVFGTSDSFVFDVLGTEYYMEGQRNNRPFAYCIIDEVRTCCCICLLLNVFVCFAI